MIKNKVKSAGITSNNYSIEIDEDTPKPYSPERELARAVFQLALADLTSTNYKRSALFWLEEEEETHLHSFEGICKMLDLDAVRIRRQVLILSKIRFKNRLNK